MIKILALIPVLLIISSCSEKTTTEKSEENAMADLEKEMEQTQKDSEIGEPNEIDYEQLFDPEKFSSQIRPDYLDWELAKDYSDTLIFVQLTNFTWPQVTFTTKDERYISMRYDLDKHSFPNEKSVVKVMWNINGYPNADNSGTYFIETLKSITAIPLELGDYVKDSINTQIFTYKGVNAYQFDVDLIFEDSNGREISFSSVSKAIADPEDNDFYYTTNEAGQTFGSFHDNNSEKKIELTYSFRRIYDGEIDGLSDSREIIEYKWLDEVGSEVNMDFQSSIRPNFHQWKIGELYNDEMTYLFMDDNYDYYYSFFLTQMGDTVSLVYSNVDLPPINTQVIVTWEISGLSEAGEGEELYYQERLKSWRSIN